MFRLGLIGTGGFAGAHLRAARTLADRTKTVALASRSLERLHKRAEQNAVTRFGTDPGVVINAPDVDGVIICTPHQSHAELAIRALDAGKHVLVEKPMAISSAEGETMVAAATAAGRILMVGQCARYHRQHQAVKRLIDAGDLGEIRSGRIDALQNAAAFLPKDHWLRDRTAAGGGILWSVAVHRLDLLRWWLGEPAQVMAFSRRIDPAMGEGVDDLVLATIRFTGGALIELFASWGAWRLPYSESLMLLGDRGLVHALPGPTAVQFPRLQVARAGLTPPATDFSSQFGGFSDLPDDPAGLPTGDMVTDQRAHFIDCCLTGSEPRSSGRDNLGTLRLLEAIEAAAAGGRLVELPRW